MTLPKDARDFLAEITKAPSQRPSSVFAYGPPGIGKTSIAAAVPGVLFLHDDKEDGLSSLQSSGLIAEVPRLPPMDSWLNVKEVLRQLAEQTPDWLKALAIDTVGGMERLCHEYVCNTQFNGNWGEKGFASFGKGYEVSLPEWREFLNLLDGLRDQGVQIIGLGHANVTTVKNPLGENYDHFAPEMHAKTWNLTHRWADLVLFLNYHVEVAETAKTKQLRGRGGKRRVIYTEFSPAFEAKNRFGLEEEIEMGESGVEAWTNLKKAIAESRKKEK